MLNHNNLQYSASGRNPRCSIKLLKKGIYDPN